MIIENIAFIKSRQESPIHQSDGKEEDSFKDYNPLLNSDNDAINKNINLFVNNTEKDFRKVETNISRKEIRKRNIKKDDHLANSCNPLSTREIQLRSQNPTQINAELTNLVESKEIFSTGLNTVKSLIDKPISEEEGNVEKGRNLIKS